MTSAHQNRFHELVRNEERANGQRANDWLLYEQHRRTQTTVIVNAVPVHGRAVFFGAGNCNDLDLERLADHLSEIHLVDIDGAALVRALERQPARVRAKVEIHGNVDLTGLLHRLSDDALPRTFDAIHACVDEAAESLTKRLPGGFDLAVSGCLMTQLYHAVSFIVPAADAMALSLKHAAMIVHLRTLAHAVAPGGTVLVTNDLTSSDSYPIETLPPDRLVECVDDMASRHLATEAGSPIVLRKLMRSDRRLRHALENPEIKAAWLWTGPMERTYLVYALHMLRTSAIC